MKFEIELVLLPRNLRRNGAVWQASHGISHGLGLTKTQAVSRLMQELAYTKLFKALDDEQ